jgi:ribonuclease HII
VPQRLARSTSINIISYTVSTTKHIMLPSSLEAGRIEAGCDEAGRGCLAGPVYAAAVILPEGFTHPLLKDSKKLSDAQRRQMRDIIIDVAVGWSVASVSAAEIDEINILNASILAMHRALSGLKVRPDAIVVDGNRFKPWEDVPYQTVVKGDAKLGNIAAASILAKTFRDDYMDSIAADYPAYDWTSNKGYPTRAHRQAIALHGTTPHHRLTFRLLP